MRLAIAPGLFVVAAAVVGCGGDGPAPSPDAVGARVTGCDDPSLWSVPARAQAHSHAEIGGGPCSPAQYPLHQAFVGWFPADGIPAEDASRLDRTCWRVTDASPGSGWSAGQQFAAGPEGAALTVMGFAHTVTVEGRVLRDDGTVAFAIEPAAVTLDDARVLDDDATATTAVMSPEAWAELDALQLWGERIATDEVVAATAFPFVNSSPITIHRTGTGLVRRTWWREDGLPQHADVALGAGTRARIAKFGVAVVVDDELVFIGQVGGTDVVTQRVQLGAEPRELVGNYYAVTLHMDGSLVVYDRATVTAHSLPVGDGVLLPTPRDDAPVFFDGTTFRSLDMSSDPLAFDDLTTFSPRAGDLAALGAPVAVFHGIVFGEHGLLVAIDAASTVPGPRFASYADLFGDGTLGPIAADSAAYVIARGDGSAALYNAPFVDYCE